MDAAATLAAELRDMGAEAEFVRADVRDDDEVGRAVARCDAAVNNAGTEGQPGPVTEQTAEGFTALFETNVLGTLLGMSTTARHAGAGQRQHRQYLLDDGGRGAANLSLYTGSKHAVEGITKSAALEAAAFGVG